MMILVCPVCALHIDSADRCISLRSTGRCMESMGHEGYHWSDMGYGNGVLIWTGLFQKRSCAGRLSLSDWCKSPPGHEGPHNNGHGITFVEGWEDDDLTFPPAGGVS